MLAVRRVRAFADHHHAVLMNHDEFAAVGFLEYFGIENFVGPAFGNDTVIETNRPGQMRGHPVQIMGGEHDGDPMVRSFSPGSICSTCDSDARRRSCRLEHAANSGTRASSSVRAW